MKKFIKDNKNWVLSHFNSFLSLLVKINKILFGRWNIEIGIMKNYFRPEILNI